MNLSRLSFLLRLPSQVTESQLDTSRLTHDLSSHRRWTPADSGASLNKHCLRAANSGSSPKARSGPGRRQVHSPTTSIAGPPPNPNDLSGQSCRQSRPALTEMGGDESPLPPYPPLPSSLFRWWRRPAGRSQNRPNPITGSANVAANVYRTQQSETPNLRLNY